MEHHVFTIVTDEQGKLDANSNREQDAVILSFLNELKKPIIVIVEIKAVKSYKGPLREPVQLGKAILQHPMAKKVYIVHDPKNFGIGLALQMLKLTGAFSLFSSVEDAAKSAATVSA